jgi:hypothetical protein
VTAIHDFCDTIRSWLAIGEDVYPDSVVTTWVRMTEKILGKELRCKEMVQIDTGTIIDQRYLLPSDWRELIFVRIVGGKVLRYIPKDDFYNADYSCDQKSGYTLSGNYIIVGGTPVDVVYYPDGINLEITYYQSLPLLEDTVTWPLEEYPMMFTMKVLHVASTYSLEDERSTMWKNQSDELIKEINDEHLLSKASGSRLTRRHLGQMRSFG